MHWFQDNGRQRSRILYAFRSPSGTRVGRDALDPGLMRQLELQNPGIPFDWKAVLGEKQVIEPSAELRRRRPKKGEEPKAAAAPAPAESRGPPVPPRRRPRTRRSRLKGVRSAGHAEPFFEREYLVEPSLMARFARERRAEERCDDVLCQRRPDDARADAQHVH